MMSKDRQQSSKGPTSRTIGSKLRLVAGCVACCLLVANQLSAQDCSISGDNGTTSAVFADLPEERGLDAWESARGPTTSQRC